MDCCIKPTRKERERSQKRQEIIDAATKLFAEKGFNNTTLDEIANASEFGKGTLYNYFENKDEIYSVILDEIIKKNVEIIKEADESSQTLIEFFKKYTLSLFEYCYSNSDSFLVLVNFYLKLAESYFQKNKDPFRDYHDEFDSVIIERINRGIKAGEIKRFDAEKLHNLYLNMLYPYVTYLIHQNIEENDFTSQTDLILEVLFNGIVKRESDKEKS